MPHLKFSRDKRGYEHTFVVHGERRRGRSRSRILYWFRTPPGVRVGRAALDPEAIRLIEQRHPDIVFDWPRILKGDGGEEKRTRPERQPGGRPAGRPEGPPPRRPSQTRPSEARGPQAPAAAPSAPVAPPVPETPAPRDADLEAVVQAPDAAPETVMFDQPPVEGAESPVPEPAPDTPAGHRLGAEGLARLRARYAEVLARIDEKATDPAQQAQLKAQAEPLNPDGWVTAEEVTAGLEQYEAVYESLRAVVGRRRARRKR